MLPIMPCFRRLATKMMSRGQKQDAQIFDDLAGTWWDERGPHRLLHRMNPLRLSYIQEYGDVGGLDILDVGCGGGIVCEPLARLGAHVTGLDASSPSIDIAREHAAQVHSLGQGIRGRRLPRRQLQAARVRDRQVRQHAPERSGSPAQPHGRGQGGAL